MDSTARIADRFRLDHVVGRGAAGIVYRGHDEASGEPVAVKVLGEAGVDDDERERLLREGRILKNLRADGIVSVVGFGSLEEPFVEPQLTEQQAGRVGGGALDAHLWALARLPKPVGVGEPLAVEHLAGGRGATELHAGQ